MLYLLFIIYNLDLLSFTVRSSLLVCLCFSFSSERSGRRSYLYPEEVEPIISKVTGAGKKIFVASETDSTALEPYRTFAQNFAENEEEIALHWPEDGTPVVVSEAKAFVSVMDYLEQNSVEFVSAQLAMVPETVVRVSGKDAESVLRLAERLEDLDDVQKVHANFDIDEEELQKLTGS